MSSQSEHAWKSVPIGDFPETLQMRCKAHLFLLDCCFNCICGTIIPDAVQLFMFVFALTMLESCALLAAQTSQWYLITCSFGIEFELFKNFCISVDLNLLEVSLSLSYPAWLNEKRATVERGQSSSTESWKGLNELWHPLVRGHQLVLAIIRLQSNVQWLMVLLYLYHGPPGFLPYTTLLDTWSDWDLRIKLRRDSPPVINMYSWILERFGYKRYPSNDIGMCPLHYVSHVSSQIRVSLLMWKLLTPKTFPSK